MRSGLLLFLFVCCMFSVNAQDPAFTQYQSAPLYLNPGFAGSNGCAKAAAGYRLQWPKISGGYRTSIVSYDHYIDAIKGGAGIMYLHDEAGELPLTTDRIDLVYAAHLKLFNEKLVLRPGIDVGYFARKVDLSQISTMSPENGDGKRSSVDIGAGVLFVTKHVYGGFAAHHLTEPNQSLLGGTSHLPMKLTAHAAGIIGDPTADNTFSFSPHAEYMMQQDFDQLVFGLAAKYDKYILGISYRNEDALIFEAAFQNDLLRVGYSYDHTISSLTNETGGSHELMVSFNIMSKKEKTITPLTAIAF